MRVFAAAGLPSIAFKHWWPDDSERGVVVQKATFDVRPDGACEYAVIQPGLALTDVFSGAANKSSTLAESDLAPCKTATDVLVNAVARAPGGRPLPDWRVGVSIRDRLTVGFHVCGPRSWRGAGSGWTLEAPEPVASVPLVYELAFGGVAREDDGTAITHEFNPIGAGLFSKSMRNGRDPVAAPRIGLLAEFMQQDPSRTMTVCGTLPVGRAWLPRRSFAGVFDDAWRSSRHPRMPHGYDFTYWNAAPAALQARPFLQGDEVIELQGMNEAAGPIAIALPGIVGAFRLKREGTAPTEPGRMTLDTVAIDVASDEPAERRLTLTWRVSFERPGDVEAVQTSAAPLERE